MVFDLYGGWAPATTTCLFKLTKKAAGTERCDKESFQDLWEDLRFRVASTIAFRQYRLIENFNWRSQRTTANWVAAEPIREYRLVYGGVGADPLALRLVRL
jgi:hypothetical protein